VFYVCVYRSIYVYVKPFTKGTYPGGPILTKRHANAGKGID